MCFFFCQSLIIWVTFASFSVIFVQSPGKIITLDQFHVQLVLFSVCS